MGVLNIGSMAAGLLWKTPVRSAGSLFGFCVGASLAEPDFMTRVTEFGLSIIPGSERNIFSSFTSLMLTTLTAVRKAAFQIYLISFLCGLWFIQTVRYLRLTAQNGDGFGVGALRVLIASVAILIGGLPGFVTAKAIGLVTFGSAFSADYGSFYDPEELSEEFGWPDDGEGVSILGDDRITPIDGVEELLSQSGDIEFAALDNLSRLEFTREIWVFLAMVFGSMVVSYLSYRGVLWLFCRIPSVRRLMAPS